MVDALAQTAFVAVQDKKHPLIRRLLGRRSIHTSVEQTMNDGVERHNATRAVAKVLLQLRLVPPIPEEQVVPWASLIWLMVHKAAV